MALTPRERKARQRARYAEMGMREYRMDLTATEREAIAAGAAARGYDDQTEYLLALVYADRVDASKASRKCPDCNGRGCFSCCNSEAEIRACNGETTNARARTS